MWAIVNLATASVAVDDDPSLADEQTLVQTVERTGYSAAVTTSRTTTPSSATPADCRAGSGWRYRWLSP